jgi:hypothetical protein
MDASTDNCIEPDMALLSFLVLQLFYLLLFVLFLICKLIPPTGLNMNDLGSKTNGTAVSLQM